MLQQFLFILHAVSAVQGVVLTDRSTSDLPRAFCRPSSLSSSSLSNSALSSSTSSLSSISSVSSTSTSTSSVSSSSVASTSTSFTILSSISTTTSISSSSTDTSSSTLSTETSTSSSSSSITSETSLITSSTTTSSITSTTTIVVVAPSCTSGLKCSSGGYRYDYHCGEVISSGGNPNTPVVVANADGCVTVCDSDPTCEGWSFTYTTGFCTTYSPLGNSYTTQQDPNGVWAVYMNGDCPV